MESRSWVFEIALFKEEADKKGRERVYLVHATEVAIRRHRKINDQANSYDFDWSEYLLRYKMLQTRKGGRKAFSLWLDQGGICPICQQP